MKKIYLIGGAMGVGKTTVAQILKTKLSNSVFLDGDWCWDSDPFQVTEETKIMVIDNISHLSDIGGVLLFPAFGVIPGAEYHDSPETLLAVVGTAPA